MIRTNFFRCFLLALMTAFQLFTTGCEGKKAARVKGTLMVKGKPLATTPGTIVTLQFIPKDGGNTFSGKVPPGEGSYEVEIPSGTYNVMFLIHDAKSGKPIPKLKTLKANLEIQSDLTLDLETEP